MPPEYEYISPDGSEKMTLWQSVHDEHQYVVAGVKWDRVWTVPQIAADIKLDPFSQSQFMDKTKTGTLGDLEDRAAEMSAARAEKRDGLDPISGAVKKKGISKAKEATIEIG